MDVVQILGKESAFKSYDSDLCNSGLAIYPAMFVLSNGILELELIILLASVTAVADTP